MAIEFYRPYFPMDSRRRILEGIDGILASGRLMMGEHAARLEAEFARYHGTAFAAATSTCTSALQICLMHFDVRGREVLVPAAGFITDVSVIRWAGGTPVFVNVDPATLSFDLPDLKRKLTKRTRGAIWIHLVGLVSPAWREIVAFAKEHGLFLLEDCAHAHGASVDGKMAGALGDAGCFSFYPTKVMTSGTGGIIVTSDAALERSAREIRLFGHENGERSKRVYREGNDWFLDEIRACVAYSQLQDLNGFLARRRELAGIYRQQLAGTPGLTLLDVPAGSRPAWYQFPVFLDRSLDYPRVAKTLADKYGVPSKPIYLPLHQEQVFRDLDDGTLTEAADALNRSLCLPLFVEMQDEHAVEAAQALKAVLDNERASASKPSAGRRRTERKPARQSPGDRTRPHT